MLKSKSKRKQRRNQNPLNTERLEQRAMFSVSPVEPVVALDVGPVNQDGYDCQGEGHFQLTHRLGGTASPGGSTFLTDTGGRSIVHPSFNVGNDGRSIVHPQFNVGNDGRSIVHPQFNVGNDGRSIVHPQFNVGNNGPMVATVMTGVLNLNPHDSPGPLISDVLQGWDWDEDIIASMDVGAPFETLLDREFEVPEILDLPSRDVLGSELNHDLQNMHPIDTALMDQSITEAMMHDIYVDMVLGSVVYQEGDEVDAPADQPNQGIVIGSAWYARKEQRHNSTSDVQDGTAPPVDLDGDGDCEDYEGVNHCPADENDPNGNGPAEEEDSSESESDDCFPPIILEEIYGDLGKEEIQFNHLGHDNLASFVDVREMIPTQNHLTQSFVSNYSYANSYTRSQAFQNWH